MIAGGRNHQQAQARPCRFGVDLLDDVARIGDVGAAPARARIGNLEVTPRRRAPPAHPDAGRFHVEDAPRLMFGEDAGDMIIDDDDFIDMRLPLLGEHADRRRTAADPHAGFLNTVDHRRGGRP